MNIIWYLAIHVIADSSPHIWLSRRMMGGSQQKQHTKYKLLSCTIIHLLHSDQFVLINPHKGAVSETKASREQWEYPTLSPCSHRQSSSASPLPLHIVAPLLLQGFQFYEQETNRAVSKQGTPERQGEKKFPLFPLQEWKIFPKKEKNNHNARSCVIFRSLHQSSLKKILTGCKRSKDKEEEGELQ